MRTSIDVVLAEPEPTREELVSMATDVRQVLDHSQRLIESLLVLARNDQARSLTDSLDLAAVAEDALEGRTARSRDSTTAPDTTGSDSASRSSIRSQRCTPAR